MAISVASCIISIRAPREGSDGSLSGHVRAIRRISIRAPREGSDRIAPIAHPRPNIFLSALPARGATIQHRAKPCIARFLSALPARGATRIGVLPPHLLHISIRAPREGSDLGE